MGGRPQLASSDPGPVCESSRAHKRSREEPKATPDSTIEMAHKACRAGRGAFSIIQNGLKMFQKWVKIKHVKMVKGRSYCHSGMESGLQGLQAGPYSNRTK